jgi:hypothetical protein
MTAAEPKTPVRPAGRSERWILLAAAVFALVPYLEYRGLFARLYWFGDDFDMIDQMDRMGFWRWTWLAYGENFVPLFKLLWGGSVLAFGGSYVAMITLVWMTHALNVALLGRLMRSCGLPWMAVFSAQLVLGLTPATIETLAWSVQWSSVMSVTFLLLALDCFFRAPFGRAPIAWAAASALSFARGLLTGALLALASLLPGAAGRNERLSRRLGYSLACLVPTVAVAVLISLLVPAADKPHMDGKWGGAAVYGAWYYCLNPAYYLLGVESWGSRTVVLLGVLKLALVAWTLHRSQGRARALFLVLLAFDLGYAVLLGIGRYHTGLHAANSSRYQYASILAVMPAFGFLVSRLFERVPGPAGFRRLAFAAVLAFAAASMCRQWSVEIGHFASWRGTETRQLLLVDPAPAPFAVPGYPGFPTQRAKDLIEKYHLH